jgi:hypothetical protein
VAAIALPVITSDRSGLAASGAGTIGTAGSPFTFPNSGNQIVRVKSTAIDAALVAAYGGTTPDGLTVGGKSTGALTASSDFFFGPFPVAVYGNVVSLTGPVLATTTLWVIQLVPNQ